MEASDRRRGDRRVGRRGRAAPARLVGHGAGAGAEFTVVGAGISLWPNAFRALDVDRRDRELGGERLGVAGGLRDWRGRWIVRMDQGAAATEHTASALVAHRHDLRSALLDHGAGGVPAWPACASAACAREGARAVVEHDGGELSADLVVGADGVRSAVRGALWPRPRRRRYSGTRRGG